MPIVFDGISCFLVRPLEIADLYMNTLFQNPCNIFGLIALKLITTPACIIDYIKTLGTYMYSAAEHTQ